MARETKRFKFGPFDLDAGQRLLLRDGNIVQLAPKASELLLALVQSGGRLLSKEDLLRQVWPDSFVEEANLSHNIYKLREALGDGADGQEYIDRTKTFACPGTSRASMPVWAITLNLKR